MALQSPVRIGSVLLLGLVLGLSLRCAGACPFHRQARGHRPSKASLRTVSRQNLDTVIPGCNKTQLGERCAGAPGRPYVEYKGCCVGLCREDPAKGWGRWCTLVSPGSARDSADTSIKPSTTYVTGDGPRRDADVVDLTGREPRDTGTGGAEGSDTGRRSTNTTTAKCSAKFKGEQVSFQGCRIGANGGLNVYWTVDNKTSTIRTLFSLKASDGGWAAFGWGFEKMVPASAAVVYVDQESDEAQLKDYSLRARSASGVKPGTALKLSDEDAEFVDGRLVGIFTQPLGENLKAAGANTAIWASGPSVTADGELGYHATRRFSGSFDLSSTSSDEETPSASPDSVEENEEESTKPSAGSSQSSTSCSAKYRGEEREFQACRIGLEGGVNAYWTIDESSGEITTLITRKATKGYLGWGWGSRVMVPATATVVYTDSSGVAQIRDYDLKGRSTSGVTPKETPIITNASAEVDGGTISGIFTRALDGRVSNGPTDAIWAVGDMDEGTSLMYHSRRGAGRFDLSQSSGEQDSVGVKVAQVFITHGILMVVAWLILSPVGILFMRFGKRFNPFAFQIHRALLMFAYLIAVIAISLALSKGSRKEKLHLSLGIVVLVAATLQVVIGTFRPGKGTKLRPAFYLVHSNLGRGTYLAAAANVFVGLSIANSGTVYYVLCGLLVGAFILALIICQLLGVSSKEDFESEEKEPQISSVEEDGGEASA